MATSNSRDVKLAVEIQAAGEENLQRLAAEVRALAKAGSDAAPQYLELATEIERVAAQARELSAFKAAAVGINESTAATERAVVAAGQLSIAFKEQQATTETVRAAQAGIKAALDSTKLAIAEQVKEQGLLKASRLAGTASDKEYAAQASEIAIKLANLKQQQAGLNVELGQAKVVTKEANTALSAMAASSLAASANAQALQAALRAQASAMQQAQEAGAKLGADFTDVAAAQERLDASLKGGVAALEANALAARALAEADRLLALESKGLSDQLERGRAAAASELSSIKESEAFTRRFAAAQLETSKAVEALTNDLDRQAATVRGTLITSMNAAAAAYEAEQNSLRESIALGEKRAIAQREQADADRLAALELKGMAEARARSTVAAQSELAAIKDADEFTRKFEKSQRDTAAAVQALTDDLDRQAALVQGRLVKSLADAAAGYDKAEKEAEQAAVAANRVNGYFEKLSAQQDVLKNAFGATGVRSIQAIEQEMFKVSQALVVLRTEFAGGRISIADFERATASAQVRLSALKTEIATIPGNKSAFDALSGSVNDMVTKFGALAAVVATVGFAVKPVIDAFVALESTRRILTQVTGSAAEAGKQIEFLRNVAQQSGQSFTEVSTSYAKFAASALQAGLSTQQVQAAFQAVSLAAGNLGLSSDQAKRALEALSQIASKGTVSMEELRQQLGDALPGILPLLAKELGLTGKELNALVESGGLLANDAIPAITRALATLTPASGQVEGLTANWNRFKNVVLEAGTALVEGPLGQATGVLLTAFAGALRDVTVVAVGFSEAMSVAGKTLGLIAAALTGNIASFKQFGEELDKITLDSAAKMTQFRDRAYQTSGAVDSVAKAATGATPAVSAMGTAVQVSGQAAAAAAPQHDAAGKAIAGVGTAAASVSGSIFKLNADYEANLKIAQASAQAADKLVLASKDQAESIKTLAALTGSDAAAKRASAEASEILATAQRARTEADTQVLEILKSQRAATVALGTATADQLKQLDEKIAKQTVEVEKSQQATAAATVAAAQASLAAEALKDNTLRYGEFRVAVEAAQAEVERLTEQFKVGKATSDELSAATIGLAKAQGLLRDALEDSDRALARSNELRKAGNELSIASARVKLEEAKSVEAKAKADGDEERAARAKIAVKQIELDNSRLITQQKRDEARATIDVVDQMLAEAEAGRRELTPEKRNELEIRKLNAKAKLEEVAASDLIAGRTAAEIKQMKDVVAGIEQVGSVRERVGQRRKILTEEELEGLRRTVFGIGEVTAAMLAAENAALRYGSALKSTQYDKDKFALNSDGSRITAGGQLKPPDSSGDWEFVGDVRTNNVNAPNGTVPVTGQGYWKKKADAKSNVPSTPTPTSNNGASGRSLFESQAKRQDAANAAPSAGVVDASKIDQELMGDAMRVALESVAAAKAGDTAKARALAAEKAALTKAAYSTGGYEVRFVFAGATRTVSAESQSAAEALVRDLEAAFKAAGGG